MRGAITRSWALSALPPRVAACTSATLKPAASASAMPSATVWIETPTITWLMIFIVWPALGPPTWLMLPASSSSTGQTFATASSLPPAMIASSPVTVFSGPPLIGASTQPMPRAASASA